MFVTLIDPYVCLFISSADMNLLLLIALELRLAPLHALHDTSIVVQCTPVDMAELD